MILNEVDDVVGGEEVTETIDMERCPNAIHPSIHLLAEHRNNRVAQSKRVMDLEGREGLAWFRFIAAKARPRSGRSLASADKERLECAQLMCPTRPRVAGSKAESVLL